MNFLKNNEIELLKKKISELEKENKLLKEKVYEEVEKNGHVYVFKTDGGYKVGKTKDLNKRIRSLQTANVNNIEQMYEYKTNDQDLLEKCVHHILNKYRVNREFFKCDLNYIIMVIEIVGNVLDTLSSTYEKINKEEILRIINNKVMDIDYIYDTEEDINSLEKAKKIIMKNFKYGKQTDYVLLNNVKEILIANEIKIGPSELKKLIINIFPEVKFYDRKFIIDNQVRNVYYKLKRI